MTADPENNPSLYADLIVLDGPKPEPIVYLDREDLSLLLKKTLEDKPKNYRDPLSADTYETCKYAYEYVNEEKNRTEIRRCIVGEVAHLLGFPDEPLFRDPYISIRALFRGLGIDASTEIFLALSHAQDLQDEGLTWANVVEDILRHLHNGDFGR